jgi:UDP-N-acetylglucosamine transferase subunit ALG13
LIFVCVGSREYQFNRLIKEIDNLILLGKITEPVFAQIGNSDYVPQHLEFQKFMSKADFERYQNSADIIITHGGTGSIIGALKLGKQVICVPRLYMYNEHSDDHQLQVSSVLNELGFIITVLDEKDLCKAINFIKNTPITKKFLSHSKIVSIVESFIISNSREVKR